MTPRDPGPEHPGRPDPGPGGAPRLELYQYESCPYCARVRDTLDDLGLDYIVRTVSRSHHKRDRVEAVSGQTYVPVLVDPDRKTVLSESRDIIAYLRRHYGAKRPGGA